MSLVRYRFVVAIVVLLSLNNIAEGYQMDADNKKCEKITIPLCATMKYNLTLMPNLVGQTNQKDAELQVHEFIPLIQTGCSPWLKFFLCSLYAPMCTEQIDETLVIPACRSMCLRVKEKCEPLLRRVDFQWPAVLDCGNLPEKGERSSVLCIEPPGDHDSYDSSYDGRQNSHAEDVGLANSVGTNGNIMRLLEALKHQNHHFSPTPPLGNRHKSPKHPPVVTSSIPGSASVYKLHPQDVQCPQRYVDIGKAITRKVNDSCAPRCLADVMFKADDKQFAEVWMIIWSIFCFVSTSLTFLTFLMDNSRFKYPERPIIFLSACCLVYSSAYILRILFGAESVSCDQLRPGVSYLIQDGLENIVCIVVFLLLYFFGMASCIWWVILTFTFYLSAGRKWGREAIQGLSTYFHVVAWTFPAVKTIIVLILRRVDGDELTGLCFVGNQNPASSLAFVISPLICYLAIGSIFIVAGFFAMFRIRSDLKLDGGADLKKFENLMIKIGVFSILYTAPATCLVGCLLYERSNQDKWKVISYATPCLHLDRSSKLVDCSLPRSIPSLEIQVLKIFMFLIIGTASGVWIWSPKTVQTWKMFFSRTINLHSRRGPHANRSVRRATTKERPNESAILFQTSSTRNGF